MTELTLENKIALSEIRLERSVEMFSDAECAYKEGRYRTSVNRSFYAALHATRSILILKGIDPVKHEGVLTMLSLELVKTGILPKDTAKTFKEIMATRKTADYDDLIDIDKKDALTVLELAKKFSGQIKSKRQMLIDELKAERRQ